MHTRNRLSKKGSCKKKTNKFSGSLHRTFEEQPKEWQTYELI